MKHLLYSSIFCIALQISLIANPPADTGEEHYINMHLGGRLGNQMFQVAAALSLAEDTGAHAVFPDMAAKTADDIPINREIFFSSLDTSSPPQDKTHVFNEDPHFKYEPIPFLGNMEIFGYFQSERFFKPHKEKICELFEASDTIKEYLQENYHSLLQHPNTVAIHLRAFTIEFSGKQVGFPFIAGEFFKEAAELFPDDALFVIFSDKIEWAKEEMQDFARPHIFIENETFYHDFYLMSYCKHQIISTSSFSWWAAYLNKNPKKKVIAPTPWFHPMANHDTSNIIPKDWIAISWLD